MTEINLNITLGKLRSKEIVDTLDAAGVSDKINTLKIIFEGAVANTVWRYSADYPVFAALGDKETIAKYDAGLEDGVIRLSGTFYIVGDEDFDDSSLELVQAAYQDAFQMVIDVPELLDLDDNALFVAVKYM